jgi:hypothetical protein
MTSLAQRVGVNYPLGPVTRQDTEAYIRHRLRAVGGAEDIFTAAAIDLIHTTSRGVPRTINVLCDNALVYGFADNRQTIDDATVRQVLKEIYPTGVWDVPLGESKFQPAAAPETIAAPAGADAARSPETPSGSTDLFSQVESLLDAIDRQSRHQTDELRRMLKIVLANERARHAQLESRYHKIKKMFDAATQPAPETPSEADPAAGSESRKQ